MSTFRGAAIVLLGCTVRPKGSWAEPSDALRRRIDRAVSLYLQRGKTDRVIVSGGKRWNEFVEADVMADECVARGVEKAHIVRERCSLSTKENAKYVAEILQRDRIAHSWLVTCDWHMARAMGHFRRHDVFATPYPVAFASRSNWLTAKMFVRECVARTISGVLE